MTTNQRIPLFPLQTVLYPGGVLPLRIFETRYLDMIRYCTSRNEGFGICLLINEDEESDSSEPGEYRTASMATIGTLAEIIDFNSGDDSLLSLVVKGKRRFTINTTHVQHDGLIMGDVSWLPDDPGQAVAPHHGLLVDMLQQLHVEVERQLADQGSDSGRDFHPALDCDYDDAQNIGFRLAELLPFSLHEQQVLLEMISADARLDRMLASLSEQSDNNSD